MKLNNIILLVSAFMMLNTNLFSQQVNEKENQEINYEKLKDTFLKALEEKEENEVVGTFSLNHNYIKIKNDSLSSNLQDILMIHSYIYDSIKEKSIISEKDYKSLINKIKKLDASNLENNILSTLNDSNPKTLNKKEFDLLKDGLYKDTISIFKKKIKLIDTISKIKEDEQKFSYLKQLETIYKKQDSIKKNIAERIEEINKKDSLIKSSLKKLFLNKSKKNWLVHEINIEINEGFITDILVTLIEDVNPELKTPEKRYFTNNYPTSLVSYRRYSKNNLVEKYSNNEERINTTISLIDVLDYQHKMGKNYVPNNQTIQLSRENNVKDLILKTNINSLIDFRVYSDFLGLINETPNGIINFETSSKFFLTTINNNNCHWAKSISPFFKYSRFDNDDRSIQLNLNDSTVNRKLDLAQKSYLQLGAQLSLLEFKFSKESSFTYKIPLLLQMNISESDTIENVIDEKLTMNTVIFGVGFHLNMKRTKKFGFDLGFDFENYNQKGNSDSINTISDFTVFGAGAEIYYYNSEDSDSAFYLRMQYKTTIKPAENFASIQFGYKTSLNISSNKKIL